MSTQEEPSKTSAEIDNQTDASEPDTGSGDTVALVDLFDQLDRAAFTRSLAQRKSYYTIRSTRRS
jgi:hypothetical protein